jgi:hypothetical protein
MEISAVPNGKKYNMVSHRSGTSFYYTLMICKKLYLNYLKQFFFADDTSIIISDKDPTNFKIKINKVFDITNELFATNLLTINF